MNISNQKNGTIIIEVCENVGQNNSSLEYINLVQKYLTIAFGVPILCDLGYDEVICIGIVHIYNISDKYTGNKLEWSKLKDVNIYGMNVRYFI